MIQPRISLKEYSINPAQITFGQFTPQVKDMSIAQRSYLELNNRRKESSEKLGALDESLGKIRDNLHQDPETLSWFDNYINDQKAKIQTYVDNNDFSTAINKTVELAGRVINDGNLTGRLYANEKYNKYVKDLDDMLKANKIDQSIYDWAKDNHQYKYKELTDDEGNVVGGDLDMDTSLPVPGINFAANAMAAFKMITPKKSGSSTSRATEVSNLSDQDITRGKATYKKGESVSSSYSSGSTMEKVSVKDILDRMDELPSDTGIGYRQIEQAFEVAKHDFKKLVKQYNEAADKDPDSADTRDLAQMIEKRKKIFYNNDSFIDYNTYYARKVTDELYAKGLAYDWRTSEVKVTSGYGIKTDNNAGGGSTRFTSDYPVDGWTFDVSTGKYVSPPVLMDTGYGDVNSDVTNSASSIAAAHNGNGGK